MVVENAPTAKVPGSVVVAPYAMVRPYWKPRAVDEALPSLVMLPFKMAVDVETDDPAEVVTVGTEVGEFVVNDCILPYPVEVAFEAYALK